MNIEEFTAVLKNRYKLQDPIFIQDLKIPEVSSNTVYRYLEELCRAEKIYKFEEGIYYFSEQGFDGKPIPVNTDKIIIRKYIRDDKDEYGFCAEGTLENFLGVTFHVPAIYTIATNGIKEPKKVNVGGLWVRLLPSPVEKLITRENVILQMAAELFRISDFNTRNSTEKKYLKRFLRQNNITYIRLKTFVEDSTSKNKETILKNMRQVNPDFWA